MLDLVGDDKFFNIIFFNPNACEVVTSQLNEAHLIVFNLVEAKISNWPWKQVLDYTKNKLITPRFLLVDDDVDLREIREWKGDQKLISVFPQYERKEDFKTFLETLIARLQLFLEMEQPGNYYDFNPKVPKYGPTM